MMTAQHKFEEAKNIDSAPATALKNDPTWFSKTYQKATPEDLAEHYKQTAPVVSAPAEAYAAYQKRLEKRFHITQNNRPSAFTTFPQRPAYSFATQAVTPPPKLLLGVQPSRFAALILVACVLGGTGGYAVGNQEKLITFASTLWAEPTNVAKGSVLPGKNLKTAKLEVEDIAGAVNSPIALKIAATPAQGEAPLALRITGLPDAAYLTKGTEIALGEWVVKASDLSKAELVVPYTSSPQLSLEVSALEASTGLPAAPSQDLKVTLDMQAVPLPGVPQPKAVPFQIVPAAGPAN
jgi:hypothetical protein